MAVNQTLTTIPGHFLLGNMREFNQDTLRFLLYSRQFGDMIMVRFGPAKLYLLNHPDLIHEVLVSKASHFYKSSIIKQALGPVLGEGLFTSDGDFWKRQRKLAQPAFHTKRISNYAETMVDCTETLIQGWLEDARLDVEKEMSDVTIQVVAKTMFGGEVSGIQTLIQEVRVLLKIMDTRFSRLFQIPRWLPTSENRTLDATMASMNRLMQGFIETRRTSGEDSGDLLSMLLMARDEDNGERMSDKQLRDELMTIFGAGHETTATTLTWVWYLLAIHPEIEAKLHTELDSVLQGHRPAMDDLPRLPYTSQVIKEAMRLYPPAFATSRENSDETEIGGITFPKGTQFLINIYGMHRDSRFFINPDIFDPERFSPESEKSIDKNAYLPFGSGPRVCIGNAFAMMEARLLLATMAQQYRLSLPADMKVEPARRFTLRPRDGLRMVAHKR